MAQIELEIDNTLEKSDIVMPMLSVSVGDGASEDSSTQYTENSQLKIFGIMVPLIMINNTIIDFDAVSYFSLKSAGVLPSLVMTVEGISSIFANVIRYALRSRAISDVLVMVSAVVGAVDEYSYFSS